MNGKQLLFILIDIMYNVHMDIVKLLINSAAKDCRYDELELEYLYHGIIVLLCDGLDFASVILLSLILNRFKETIIYLFILSTLRSYTGGYHAKTIFGCLISYACIYFFAMKLYTLHCNTIIWFFIYVPLSIYTWYNAPVTHPKAPLNEREFFLCKEHTHKFILFINLLLFIFLFINKDYCKLITIIFMVNGFAMELLKWSKKGVFIWKSMY